MKHLTMWAVAALLPLSLFAQIDEGLWRDMSPAQLPAYAEGRTQTYAHSYRLLALDNELFQQWKAGNTDPIRLPLPDGSHADFEVQEAPVMSAGLAAQYPEFATWKLKGIDNPSLRGRMGWTAKGLHATIHTSEGQVYIDPYARGDREHYISYATLENNHPEWYAQFTCGVNGQLDPPEVRTQNLAIESRSGAEAVQLRTYRLAMAATGEFTQYHGGTKAMALSAIVTIVNRLNDIFEVDMATHLELISNNDLIIFEDPATDPYDNGMSFPAIQQQNTVIINNNIGVENYDIGHVVSTSNSLGGIASLSSVCSSSKAAASSTLNQPEGDPFTIDIVAHEMGHQFSATHTMSSCQNVTPSTAYEPGSGNTIMSYSGICPAGNNVALNSGPYFHTASLEQIHNFITLGNGDNCPTKTPTGNTSPEVVLPYQDGFFIPISTPFSLVAEGIDAEGDDLTYCWEQFDKEEGVQTPPGMPEGNVPLFVSTEPNADPRRIFPRINTIISGNFNFTEVLPTYTRDMTFRCTVRDNNPEGGYASWETVAFHASASAGPFRVQSPNTNADIWNVGEYVEVRWDVANTDNDTVNCQSVNILLSVDGGFTYPYTLLANTPNDGSAFVTVPDTLTSQARVMVEAADNIFFDISNNNFQIDTAAAPGYSLSVNIASTRYCLPASAEIPFTTGSLKGFDNPVTLEVLGGLPADVQASFVPASVMPGDTSMLTFDFSNTVLTQDFQVAVQATAMGADTSLRQVMVRVVSNDYSDLDLLNPSNGESGLVFSADLQWTNSVNAAYYNLELATSPLFGNDVVESVANLTDTTYTTQVLLDKNMEFYWRLQPVNECGEADFLPPYVFHTFSSSCAPLTPSDVPIPISGTGTPTIESSIFVTDNGTVSDINIPQVVGSYQPVNSLRISLESPSGTEVILYDKDCGTTVNLNIGFDDEAPNPIGCPPDDGIVFQPEGSLADFIGESTQGEWIMRVEVVEPGFGGGGGLEDWDLEFCANFQPQAPALITNDTLFTPPNATSGIYKTLLETTDPDNTSNELIYTLVQAPEQGDLLLFGNAIQVGDQFSQSNINSYGLEYRNTSGQEGPDGFYFSVNDGTGGLVPVTRFDIVLDQGAPVSTIDLRQEADLKLFPNPATDEVRLQLSGAWDTAVNIRIYDLQGRLLSHGKVNSGSGMSVMPLQGWPGGLYIIRVSDGQRSLSKKLRIR